MLRRVRVLGIKGTPKQLRVTKLNVISKNDLFIIANTDSREKLSLTNYERVPGFERKSKSKKYLRYLIWLALANTAYANARHFGLPTTWAPHLVGNSVALLLPEIYGFIDEWLGEQLRADQASSWAALQLGLEQLVRDNPDYIDYVAPAALAYIVSHPRFNIYRGEWGELNLMGFGLDSIPHSLTAYTFANLVHDTIDRVAANSRPEMAIWPWITWLNQHKILVSGAVLALLTAGYELSEYLIHKAELKARDNDLSQINMMWSIKDTVFDVISNGLGWALSAWLQRR